MRTIIFQGGHFNRRVSRLPGWQQRTERIERLVRPAAGVSSVQDPDRQTRRLEATAQENRSNQNFGTEIENLVGSFVAVT